MAIRKKTAAKKTAAKRVSTARNTANTGKRTSTAKKAAQKRAPAARKAPAKGTATVKTVSAFTVAPDRTGRYDPFKSDRALFSAYTIAALMVAGFLSLTAKGAPSKPKSKPQSALLRALIGPVAWRHWTVTRERITPDGLTVDGLNEVQRRLAGESKGYNTELSLVRAVKTAIQKGGKIDRNGRPVKFDSPVSAKRS
jgi:hypothetical protein